MALYDRLIGYDDLGNLVEGKIPIHAFSSILAEFARGRLTGAQANAAVELVSGMPLNAAEQTEAQALLATITGSATAKLARAKEVDDVLILGEHQVVEYNTPTEVRIRLGV